MGNRRGFFFFPDKNMLPRGYREIMLPAGEKVKVIVGGLRGVEHGGVLFEHTARRPCRTTTDA